VSRCKSRQARTRAVAALSCRLCVYLSFFLFPLDILILPPKLPALSDYATQPWSLLWTVHIHCATWLSHSAIPRSWITFGYPRVSFGALSTLPLTVTKSGMCAQTSFTRRLFHFGAREGRTSSIVIRKDHSCLVHVGLTCAFDQGLPFVGGTLLALDFVLGLSFSTFQVFMYILHCSAGSGLPLLYALNLFR
jgi:hypothetical protein